MRNSIGGMLEAELTSAVPGDALAAISLTGIEILYLRQMDDLTCRFWIRNPDIVRLTELCKKRGEAIHIRKRTGIYWMLRTVFHRPVLLAGMVFFFCLVLFLPTRVLFVQVEGNADIPKKKILSAAESCGITFGASRRIVRSEKVKNALLAEIPQLQWAGINTSGCVATISVRERADAEETQPSHTVSHIVAQRDGFLLSGTVIQGNGLFQPGQTVKAGQILISGYTDCGLCIRAQRAVGEVYAQTKRELQAAGLCSSRIRQAEGSRKRKISLLLRKKRINLWKDSGISDTSCVRIYEEYYVTLPGGFVLPLALCVEEYIPYAVKSVEDTDMEESLADFSRSYLLTQMAAGQIQNDTHTVTLENGLCTLNGVYICTEMIGREQIGDTNGENGGTNH